MRGEKKAHNKSLRRIHAGGLLVPGAPGGVGKFGEHSHEDRVSKDGIEETLSVATSAGSDALLGQQEIPGRKNRNQLTSTEYALQEIRNRVRAIDERWEEVNVRATNTLEDIAEEEQSRGHAKTRRWSGVATHRRKEAERKKPLKCARVGTATHLTKAGQDMLETSQAAAWLSEIDDAGRSLARDEQLAVALAQSHEGIAAASVKFEETQERNERLLGGLREWMDQFTGTARPEDTNPIAAMLPDAGLDNEVIALMTECQDAAMLLEESTNHHTVQLQEIFSQAGKLYGAEIDRVQKNGCAASEAAREKVANLQEHANKVESLLTSMQDERTLLQSRLNGAEQRCRAVEERFREDKMNLQEGLQKYQHQVMQLHRVVAGYEEKARKQEQLDRDPRLAPVLDKALTAAPSLDAEEMRLLQAETTRLSTENAALTEANKKLYRDLVVLRLADQGGKRSAPRRKPVILRVKVLLRKVSAAAAAKHETWRREPLPLLLPSVMFFLASDITDAGFDKIVRGEPDAGEAQSIDDNATAGSQSWDGSIAEEAIRVAEARAEDARGALADTKRENKVLSERLHTTLAELEKERKKTTVVNHPSADAVEQGLRDALRDLREESSAKLQGEVEARCRAAQELESALDEARKREETIAAANAEIDRVKSELVDSKKQILAGHHAGSKPEASPTSSFPESPQLQLPATAAGAPLESSASSPSNVTRIKTTESVVESAVHSAMEPAVDPAVPPEPTTTVLRAIDYNGLVKRATDGGEQEMVHITGRAGEVGLAERHLVKARNMFSGVVERCGEGLSSVEQILQGSKSVIDEDAASIQKALALALERALNSASLLLKEALIGRIRACEAEKQISLEKGLADQERAKAAALEHEKVGLLDERKQQLGQAAALRIELAALRKQTISLRERAADLEAEAAKASERVAAEESQAHTLSALETDRAMWRRRYEHLAGVLADATKESTGKTSRPATPARAQDLPRLPPDNVSAPLAATRTESSILHDAEQAARHYVDHLSDATSENKDDLIESTTKTLTSATASRPGMDSGVPLEHAADAITDFIHMGEDAIKSPCQASTPIEDAADRSGAPMTREEATPARNYSAASSREVDTDGLGDSQEPSDERSPDGVTRPESNEAGNTDGGSGHGESPGESPRTTAIDRTTGETTSADVREVQESTRENINSLRDKRPSHDAAVQADNAPGVPPDDDENTAARGAGSTRTRHSTDRIGTDGDVGPEDSGRPESRVSDKLSAAATPSTSCGDDSATRGRAHGKTIGGEPAPDRDIDDLDEDQLLDKLLDKDAPSASFEDDHQRLLSKLLRSRDEDHVRSDTVPPVVKYVPSDCEECPELKEKLSQYAAEATSLQKENVATRQELEACEDRVYVLTSDIAKLQRTLAEHADMLRHARSLADKESHRHGAVSNSPSADAPQVRAAQDFHEMSRNILKADRNGPGGAVPRFPKGKASATATARRQNRRLASASSPPARGSGRRRSSIMTPGRGGGGAGDSSSSSRCGSISEVNSTYSRDRRRTLSVGATATDGAVGHRSSVVKSEGGPPSGSRRSSVVRKPSSDQGEVQGWRVSVRDATSGLPRLDSTEFMPETAGDASGGQKREVRDAGDDTEGVSSSGQYIRTRDVEQNERKNQKVTSASCNGDLEAGVTHRLNEVDDSEVLSSAEASSDASSSFNTASATSAAIGEARNLATSIAAGADEGGGKPRPADGAMSLTMVPLDSSPPMSEIQEEQVHLDAWSHEDSAANSAGPSRPGTAHDAAVRRMGGESLQFGSSAEDHATGICWYDEEQRTQDTTKGRQCEMRRNFEATPRIDERDFDPKEKTLVAYSKAAARCKICIGALTRSIERSALTSDITIKEVASPKKADQLEWLARRYSQLFDAMLDWGVEAAAALLIELFNTAAKLGTRSAWAGAVERPGSEVVTNEGGVRTEGYSETQRDKATLLLAQKAVLREAIEALGGWEAALFLDSGGVNLDVDRSVWPTEVQMAMLSALNNHLRDELDESGNQHAEAMTDLFRRFQTLQRECEELRARREEAPWDPQTAPPKTPSTSEQQLSKSSVLEADDGDTMQKNAGSGEQTGNEGEADDEVAHHVNHEDDKTANPPPTPASKSLDGAKTDGSEAQSNDEQQQIQTQLTMTLVLLKKARDELRNEKDRRIRAEQEQERLRSAARREKTVPTPPLPDDNAARTIKMAPQPQDGASTPPQELTGLPTQERDRRPLHDDRHVLPKDAAGLQSSLVTDSAPSLTEEPPAESSLGPTPAPHSQAQAPSQPQGLSEFSSALPSALRTTDTRKKCGTKLDLIAQADLAERRAREEERARVRAAYPLEALAAERKAIANLRAALSEAICSILELCRPTVAPSEASDGSVTTCISSRAGLTGAGSGVASRYESSRGPDTALVQMVCSGDDASVRCRTSEYRLYTGLPARTCSGGAPNDSDRCRVPPSLATQQGPPLPASAPETATDTSPMKQAANRVSHVPAAATKLRETATAVAQAGTMARTLLRGFLSADSPSEGPSKAGHPPEPSALPSAGPATGLPPTDPLQALAAARAAAANVHLLSAEICCIRGLEDYDDAAVPGGFNGSWGSGTGAGTATRRVRDWEDRTPLTAPKNEATAPQIDVSATKKIVSALKEDISWAQKLPTFVQNAFAKLADQRGQQSSLKDREIEILIESNGELRSELSALQADYVSADADDVIRALRKRLRELNKKVSHSERQLQLVAKSAKVEGGSIEVLERLLRQRDTDKELAHALSLKRLEVGLKIRLLETKNGGKTVEVSRLPQHEQRAAHHLKERLMKERAALKTRKTLVTSKMERSLPLCMSAFERVSRAVQRLSDGYASLPGLLEWGRANAARVEAGRMTAAETSTFNDGDAHKHGFENMTYPATSSAGALCHRSGAATAAPRYSARNRPSGGEFARETSMFRHTVVPYSVTTLGIDSAGSKSASLLSAVESGVVAPDNPPWLAAASPASSSLPKMKRSLQMANDGGTDAHVCLRSPSHDSEGTKGGGGIPVAKPGSAWASTSSKTSMDPPSDRVSATAGSSVSTLLREERAYRKRTSGIQRSLESGNCGRSGQSPASGMVPMNNIGLPVRFRQKHHRNTVL